MHSVHRLAVAALTTTLALTGCSSASYVPEPESPAGPCAAGAAQDVRPVELGFGVPLHDGPGPYVSADRIVTARNLGTTRTERMEAYALDPRSGAERSFLREGTYETQLLDAWSGAVLFVRTPSGAGSGQPTLVYADERGERVLETMPVQGGDIPVSYQRARRGLRLVGPNRAAVIVGAELVYFDGTTTARIDRTEVKRQAHVFEDGVVYTAVTGLYLWRGGERTRLSSDVEPYNALLSASRGHVYYTARSGLWRYRVDTGAHTKLTAESCWSLSADGPRLLAVCGGDTPWLGRTVRLYDGDTARELPTAGGLVGQARLSGERAVWFEYVDLQPQMGARLARLVAWDGGAEAPRAVAQVGSPCFQCGHTFSPDPQLSFEGDLIAWSYARVRDRASTSAQHQAYAAWPLACK